MTPMMSKLAQTTSTVQQRSAYGNHFDHEPQCDNPIEITFLIQTLLILYQMLYII